MEKDFLEIHVENVTSKTNVYLYLRKNGFSEHYLKNLRNKTNAIFVNDSPSNMKTILKNGDKLKIDKNPYKPTNIKKVEKKLNIVYEDENYLVVNKPPLLATMPTKSHYDDNLAGRIVAYLNDDFFTLRILNRLDKDAEGLVLVSKNAISHQFTKNIEKEYYAICHGVVENEIVVEKPILTVNTNGINEMKRLISGEGQYAKTVFYPIKVLKNKTLLKAIITKGRTHQIRLHASSISHPLLGDKIYGIFDNYIHTYLTLKKLSFYNSMIDKTYCFEIDFSDEFKEIINEKRP